MQHSEEAKKDINSNMMEEGIGAIDRISKLPEHIIHHILSELFMNDIVRTSVLSKTWQHIWASFPISYFDQTLFGKDVSNIENQEPEIQEKRDMFIKFVDDTLHRLWEQQISTDRFKLVMTLCDIKYAHRIDRWIEMATKEDNVLKLLDINILGPKDDPLYSLPRFTSAAKSLAILRLKGCKLEHSSFDDIPNFLSLHEICLVDVYADQQIINNLFLCCPSIENFSLRSCSGIEVLTIPHLPNLEKVEVGQNSKILFRIESVEIKVPNLRSFHYNGWNTACKIDIAACKKMTELTLINVIFTDRYLESLVSKFKFLKSLDLQGCNKLERVEITSPRLERLILKCLYKLEEAKIYAPALNSFVCSSDILRSVISINSRPRNATLDLNIDEPLNTLLFLQLKEFIAKLSTRQVLCLCFCALEVTFNVEELRDISAHPLDLKRLSIKMICSSLNYEALVDGLFWSTHPETLTIFSGGFSTELIKSLCERLMDRVENRYCCSSTHIKCWRHDLKDVEIMVTARPKRTSFFYWTSYKDICFWL